MAKEIQFSLSISAFKAAVTAQTVGRAANPLTADWNGTRYVEGTMTVTQPVAAQIPLGNVRRPRWAWMRNLDSTYLITVNNSNVLYPNEAPAVMPLTGALCDPDQAATVAVSGSGGSLGVGTYRVYYTLVNQAGQESSVGDSMSAAFTVTAGQEPVVTLPSVADLTTGSTPGTSVLGVVTLNLYCTDTSQLNPRRYATGITPGATSTTYTMTGALPSLSNSNPPPPLTGQLGPYALSAVGTGFPSTQLEYLIFSY